MVIHVHTGAEMCEKSFTRAHPVKTRMVIHTGRKRAFQCLICEKSFTEAGSLKRHMLIHTGEGAFQCQMCKKIFTQAYVFITTSHQVASISKVVKITL